MSREGSHQQLIAGAVLYVSDLERMTHFYADVIGLNERNRDDDHVVLESSAGFQLVLLRSSVSSAIEIANPPIRRSDVAFKPVFVVASIEQVRGASGSRGGMLNEPGREWTFEDWRVCDGVDPEGNVIQVRARSA